MSRGRPFQPGNTFGRGRPKGSRNKITKKMQELLDKYGEVIVGKCISMASKGDKAALRLCMDRLIPVRHDGYVHIRALKAKTMEEITASIESLLKSVTEGKITPLEGDTLAGILENRRKTIETLELETRIRELEETVASSGRQE